MSTEDTILAGLKTIAPMIATALGGPLAGAATSWIASKLGVPEATVTAVTDAVQGIDPLKRQELEQQFTQWYVGEQDKMISAYLADTQSARDRDVKLAQAGQKNTRANWIAALTFTGIAACAVLSVMHSDLDDFAKGIITTLFGYLIADWKQITSFEFGTSKSSQTKDTTIANLTGKL